ncbi:hypothetical protein P5673_003670, partial [Acropora cervicornis]
VLLLNRRSSLFYKSAFGQEQTLSAEKDIILKQTAFRGILKKGACRCSPQICKNKNVCQMETRAVDVSFGFWL